ncbi:hypothetical protein IFM89_025490 [Coptis chinensis]|uniref:RING-type E3 ubiquitin transferase n=1 Tax=Coptis chinensis TaxID=261450 RepID=A0A835I748_9MAGN|nr:hypothetical protein IFM89_025490 [Coptis chinensis]
MAALRLKLTSSKALLIEKRSIQKLLDKVCDTDQAKERILKYLLYLLRKYGKSNGDLQSVNSSAQGEGRDVYTISSQNISAWNASINPEVDVGSVVHEVETDLSFQPIPPDEFRCPISLRLIHDPVVIASGQTFERVWIEKWFEDGHVTCPKTQKKLSHLSVIPNSAMKDLISKWSQKHGIRIPDPYSQPISAELYAWGTLSSSSIASFGSSLNNVPIRVDDSSLTFDSPDVNSAASQIIIGGLNSVSPQTDSHYNRCQFSFKLSHGMNSSLLSKLSEHPWELQCELLVDVRNHLDENEQACDSILCTSLIQSLRTFFKDACDRCDVTAQRIGAQVLRILVTKCRNDVPSFHEDVCHLLVSFLDSEIIEEALAIIEVLSEDQYCKSEVVASGALPSILTIIKFGKRELQVPALKIVCNLSSQTNIGTQIIHLGYVPNLISFLDDRSLAPHCIRTLENLCTTEEGRLAVGEAKYFIASIIALLEIGSHEEQEHAVAVLLSLCCHRFEYCQLVLQGGVVPSLATISINGNSKGRKNALELLRLLMDIGYSDSRRSLPPAESTAEFPPCVSGKCPVEKPSVPKAPGYFKRKIKLFPKLRSLVQY